jgi:hypothetical protein
VLTFSIHATKPIGKNKFKEEIHDVLIQEGSYWQKHEIIVNDFGGRRVGTGEHIVVQGAYDLELFLTGASQGGYKASILKFRMSKE